MDEPKEQQEMDTPQEKDMSEEPNSNSANTDTELDALSNCLNNNLKSSDENDEDICWQTDEWKSKEKHIFVLSSAGKPIYSRLSFVSRINIYTRLTFSCVKVVDLH